MSETPSSTATGGAGGSRVQALRSQWQAMAPRERRGIVLAAAVLGVYLVWAVGVQPAWRTLRSAPAQIEALDAQWQAMQRLAAEARSLRAQPAVPAAQAAPALQAATARLGEAGRLVVQADRAVLTLTDCPPEALRGWLAEVRSGAGAGAVEAQLTRGEAGLSGTVIVAFGGQP